MTAIPKINDVHHLGKILLAFRLFRAVQDVIPLLTGNIKYNVMNK